MFGGQAPNAGRVTAAGIGHVLSAGSGNTDQDIAGGSNQWAEPCAAQKPTFLS